MQTRTKNKYNKTTKKEKDYKNPHRAGRTTQARPNFKETPQQHDTNNQVNHRIQRSIIQKAYQNSSHQYLNVALNQRRNTYTKHNISHTKTTGYMPNYSSLHICAPANDKNQLSDNGHDGTNTSYPYTSYTSSPPRTIIKRTSYPAKG